MDAFFHHSRLLRYRRPQGAAPCGSGVTIAAEHNGTLAGAQVFLRLWQDGVGERLLPMSEQGGLLTATVTLPDKPCLLWYFFVIHTTDGHTLYYGGSSGSGALYKHEPPAWRITVYDGAFATPDWFCEGIAYQIFPDRFRRSSWEALYQRAQAHRNRGRLLRLHDRWLEEPAYTPAPGCTDYAPDDFFGGDLNGIREKLPYLHGLGVTCLYLTPIFRSPSNHKYDTADYFEIDPAFGTKDDLRRLVDGVHARGMRIILDGVFNHCGYWWDKFQDVVRNGEASPYRSWFFIHSYPVDAGRQNYDCVGHYKWMPKLNLADPDARDYFLSIGRYWLQEFHIDGWRLDVADELPTAFLEAFAAEMRGWKPDCILLGETWGDAGRLVNGNRLDSAMNYLFRDAAVAWLAKDALPASEFGCRLNRALALYPGETNLRMYNLLDSHDTARFLYEAGGDKARLRLAVAMQMTFPGSPAIFYGDEIGLSGPNDPGCRMAMQWDGEKQDRQLLNWYRQLISLRLASDSLTDGDYRTVLADDGANVYAFSRTVPGEQTLVILNAGTAPWRGRLPIPEWAREFAQWTLCCQTGGMTEEKPFHPTILTDDPGRFETELPAKSVKIIRSINNQLKEKVQS